MMDVKQLVFLRLARASRALSERLSPFRRPRGNDDEVER